MLATLVVGAAAAAVLGLGPFDDDDDGPALESIEVDAADVVERWNDAAVDLVDRSDGPEVDEAVPGLLAAPDWVADEELGLDVAEQVLDTWGVVTLYRHPDHRLAGVDLVGNYVSEADQARMTGTVVSLVAAVSGATAAEVDRFVQDELGFGASGGAAAGTVEFGGARYAVERTARTLQVRVTAPDSERGDEG